jgi:hypothetical protein
MKGKAIEILEGNIGEYLYILRVRKAFLNRI